MTRISWLAATTAALALGACAWAGGEAGSSSTQSLTAQPASSGVPQTAAETQAQTSMPSQAPAQARQYTDAQLAAFAAASAEIDPISTAIASQTPEQQEQSRAQIVQILERHNIDASSYNAIAQAARADHLLAARIAAAAPSAFSQSQLQAFVRAAEAIEPINQRIATATPEERAAAAAQIRSILEQNGLDAASYNAIATRAQSDATLRARIEEMRRPGSTSQGDSAD